MMEVAAQNRTGTPSSALSDGQHSGALTPSGTDSVVGAGRAGGDAPLSVAHVVDFYTRYPGERVTLFTQVTVRRQVAGFTLRVQIPAGLTVEFYRAVDRDLMPRFEVATPAESSPVEMLNGDLREALALQRRLNAPTRFMVWRVTEEQVAGSQFEFQADAVVEPVYSDISLRSHALVYAGLEERLQADDGELVEVAVRSKGRYLRYLPALYEQDEFMVRFLMLFESFWRPIEQQIGGIHNYLDADFTPPSFLPWLASWFHLTLERHFTEAQRRRLLKSIMRLYRRRGTKQALQEYLEILTDNPVEIVERRAKNFQVGRNARIGVGVALGTKNVPHTFTVHVRLSPLPAIGENGEPIGEAESKQRELERRRVIMAVIDAEKPAHTSYDLQIDEV